MSGSGSTGDAWSSIDAAFSTVTTRPGSTPIATAWAAQNREMATTRAQEGEATRTSWRALQDPRGPAMRSSGGACQCHTMAGRGRERIAKRAAMARSSSR